MLEVGSGYTAILRSGDKRVIHFQRIRYLRIPFPGHGRVESWFGPREIWNTTFLLADR